MATKENEKVMDFMHENPQIKGSCYGGGNGFVSRINDGWYQQDRYYFKAPVIIEYINKLRRLIPQDVFKENFPEDERIGWDA